MTNYDHLHELEIVTFRSGKPRPRKELLRVFGSQGFTLHDDVFSLDRLGKQPPWQHSSFVELEVRYQNEEVFGFEEGVWDELRLKYLFAFLPFECVEEFMRSVEATSQHLGISPEFRGQATDRLKLRKDFEQIRMT